MYTDILGVFLMGLLLVSTLTTLTTEAVKKLCQEHNKKYYSNTLAGLCSLVVSSLVGAGYIIFTNTTVTPQIITCLVALVILGWLCAMVGYDKVIQALGQFKHYSDRKDE
ncbi:MAG: aminopeptidase [Lachnospiraceae bacterium]|nr:aminopeptidase [Lachnospiraceae bacterium]